MHRQAFSLTGTVFLEFWKRQNATLAYEWNVNNFEANEPDRPEFYGTEINEVHVCSYSCWKKYSLHIIVGDIQK